MTNEAKFQIRFVDATPAEGNMYAASLEEHLQDVLAGAGGVEVERARTRADAQDFGATLVLVLGTAAATAVAKGIQSWLAAHTGTTIEITDPAGRLVAKNIDAQSAAAIAQAFSQRSTAQ